MTATWTTGLPVRQVLGAGLLVVVYGLSRITDPISLQVGVASYSVAADCALSGRAEGRSQSREYIEDDKAR